MKMKKIGAVCVTLLLLLSFSVYCVTEIKIAAKRRDQTSPAVYGSIVVWEDLRNLRWDVYGFNLSESREIRFAPYSCNPAIYKNILVWVYQGEGSVDLRGYNLETQQEFQIVTSPSSFKGTPALYENMVVWVHWTRDYDIYGYNLDTEQEVHISAHIDDQNNPAIYGDYVVWQDRRNYTWDIYGLNLKTGEEIEIAAAPENQEHPAIYGRYVVWTDSRNGSYDIYGLNLKTGEEMVITTSAGDQKNPAIYGNIIVWQDNRNGSYDIYGYDLSESQEFPLITSEGDQQNPAIHGNTVVWEDNRNGTWDIYGVYLPAVPLDKDGDGYSYPDDCDDNDPEIHPWTEEVCDRKDNDCDGQIDELCRRAVEVFVIGSRGEGLQGASIFVNGAYKGKTDSEGKIIVKDLFIDYKYTVSIEKEGYAPEEKSITVKEGETVIVVEMGTGIGTAELLGFIMVGVFGVMLFMVVLKMRVTITKRKAPPAAHPLKQVCSLCKTPVQEDWAVCPHCGADLEEQMKDETQVY
jgi:beta propeller repeat protein